MRRSARVTSLDALVRFKAALGEFDENARAALGSAESEIQRTMLWLQSECPNHWGRQIRRRQHDLTLAKSELLRAELEQRENKRSCVLERRAVEKAAHRLKEAEHKLERSRYWARTLEREFLQYKGKMQGMAGQLERDVPKAMHRLDALLEHLHKYMAKGPATASTAPSDTGKPAKSEAPPAGDGT